MEFAPKVARNLHQMEPLIFRQALMGLQHHAPLSREERFQYHEADNVLYVNFEGLTIETEEDVRVLADYLDRHYASFDKRFNVIINYDNFQLNPSASEAFFAIVKQNLEQYVLSSTCYCTSALSRRQLGQQFTEARREQRMYGSFDEAKLHL
jgi:propionate CoA-transferase